jgi:hypothetical protein
MSVEEFHAGMDIAHGLHSRQATRRERAAHGLLAMGPAGIRLAAYTIEEVIMDDRETDDGIDRQEEVVASLVRRVGRDAVPVLEDLATNGECNISVNLWAQDLIFEVLGLEGDARRQACHHGTKVKDRRGGREVWACEFCEAEFGDGERPTDEPTDDGGDRIDAVR